MESVETRIHAERWRNSAVAPLKMGTLRGAVCVSLAVVHHQDAERANDRQMAGRGRLSSKTAYATFKGSIGASAVVH